MNFIQQAYKGKNDWWRWLLISLLVLYPYLKNVVDYLRFYDPNKKVPQFTGDVNGYILNSVLKSIGYFIVFILLFSFLHKRSIKTLITTKRKYNWWRFIFGFSTWSLVTISYLSVSYLQFPEAYQWNFKLEPFLKLLLISVTLLPIRSIFLELFFRGYLLQGFGMLTKSKLLAMVFSALLFTLIFGVNPMLHKVGYTMLIFFFASALLSAVITLLDERAEIAMGMHVASNILGLVYITTLWTPYQTSSLLLDTSPPKVLYLVFIPVFVFFPLYLLLLTKVYRWENWKEKLLGKLEKPRM